MSTFWEGVVTIMLALTTVAIVAVIVSKKSQTPQVLQSWFSGFGNDLGVAVSPVTGSGYQINLGYPEQGIMG